MSDVKVSIIVPVYNAEKYLKQCLDSIIAQTLRNIEIILINDGSTDNCPGMIDEYAAKDPRIVAVHKENQGYGAACNTGLVKAMGEYIGIVEADDFITPEMYEKLYAATENGKVDIVKSAYWLYYGFNGEERIEKPFISDIPQISGAFKISDAPVFLHYHPSIWSAIYKNSFIKSKNIKFVEPKGAGWADNPFHVETMCLAESIIWLNEPYYYYRQDNPDASSNLKDYNIPIDRLNEIHDFFDKHPDIYDDVCVPFTKKALWNVDKARKVAFMYEKNIPEAEKKIKAALKRTPEWVLERDGVKRDIKAKYYKLLKRNYLLSYWYRKLRGRLNEAD